MSEFQNIIFNQQMNNSQIDKPQINPQINQNDILNIQNQIQNSNSNSNQPLFNQFQNPNYNLNNYVNNNINMNQNINLNNLNNNTNNNFPNQNINNMNKIELNFEDLNENLGNNNQIKNQEKININQNNININNLQSQQEEKIPQEETKFENKNNNNNNNNSISSSKQNKKEESQLNPNKKLENKFSFLYRIDENIRYQSQKQVMEKEKYESQVKKIADFDTIEDFWSIFQHLRKPDSCIPGIEYFMFKEPIKPLWEDENNKNGGRFSIKLKHGYTTIIWEEMIFALIGGILPKEMKDQINGIVVTSRKEFNTLQIWFKNYDDKITEDLEQCIRDLLVIPSEVKIEKRQFNKKDNGNNNNSNKNINNNKSGGYHNRGYNNGNNNYDNGGHGNYYKEHKKGKHQSNRK